MLTFHKTASNFNGRLLIEVCAKKFQVLLERRKSELLAMNYSDTRVNATFFLLPTNRISGIFSRTPGTFFLGR
jgi:hypothetical protein